MGSPAIWLRRQRRQTATFSLRFQTETQQEADSERSLACRWLESGSSQGPRDPQSRFRSSSDRAKTTNSACPPNDDQGISKSPLAPASSLEAGCDRCWARPVMTQPNRWSALPLYCSCASSRASRRICTRLQGGTAARQRGLSAVTPPTV